MSGCSLAELWMDEYVFRLKVTKKRFYSIMCEARKNVNIRMKETFFFSMEERVISRRYVAVWKCIICLYCKAFYILELSINRKRKKRLIPKIFPHVIKLFCYFLFISGAMWLEYSLWYPEQYAINFNVRKLC